jgi:hypothetical protein
VESLTVSSSPCLSALSGEGPARPGGGSREPQPRVGRAPALRPQGSRRWLQVVASREKGQRRSGRERAGVGELHHCDRGPRKKHVFAEGIFPRLERKGLPFPLAPGTRNRPPAGRSRTPQGRRSPRSEPRGPARGPHPHRSARLCPVRRGHPRSVKGPWQSVTPCVPTASRARLSR